jgi:hypothetical protein
MEACADCSRSIALAKTSGFGTLETWRGLLGMSAFAQAEFFGSCPNADLDATCRYDFFTPGGTRLPARTSDFGQ